MQSNDFGHGEIDCNQMNLDLEDKGVEMFSQTERVAAQSTLDVFSFSKTPQGPQKSMFFEKLPREIRTIIYKHFDMPRWVIDIPQSRKLPGASLDYTPQELVDNSLETCLSSELLNICTQIRKEYKEDGFGVLPTSIHFLGDAKAKPFSKRQLAQLPPLINAMIFDIGKAQSNLKAAKLRSKKLSKNAPRPDSIARNIHLVRHLDISLIIDTYNATLSRPRKAMSLVAGLLAAQVQTRNPSGLTLLFSRLTKVSICVDFKNIHPAGTPLPDSWLIQKRVMGALSERIGVLWVKGSLEYCNVVVCNSQSPVQGDAIFRSREKRSSEVTASGVRTVQSVRDARVVWNRDLQTGRQVMVEAINNEIMTTPATEADDVGILREKISTLEICSA